jgi:hypothetical protein
MLIRGNMALAVALTLMNGITAGAQQPVDTPEPSPEHKKLAAFVGTWRDEAEMKPSVRTGRKDEPHGNLRVVG